MQLVENRFEKKNIQKVNSGTIVESDRAVAQIQAMVVLARRFPRSESDAWTHIKAACESPLLAQVAQYEFSRGGQAIKGPTIRLIEEMARLWRNIKYGWKEIERCEGYSICMAYAWDLEANNCQDREVIVPHFRDTKKGKFPITDSRDINDMCANLCARRVRECLKSLLPIDLINLATAQCDKTLLASELITPETIKKLLDAFEKIGVSKKQIEKKINRNIDAIAPAQMISLRNIFTGIKDGMGTVADAFEPEPVIEPENKTAKELDDDIPEFTAKKQAKTEDAPEAKPDIPESKPEKESAADGMIATVKTLTKVQAVDNFLKSQGANLMQLKGTDEAGYSRFMDAVTARKAELAAPVSDFPGDRV